MADKILTAFPNQLANRINTLHTEEGIDKYYSIASILYSISTASRKNIKVQIKEGFEESALIYSVLVGEPGTKKSPAMKIWCSPLVELERQFQEQDPNAPNLDTTKLLVSDFTPEGLYNLLRTYRDGLGVFTDELNTWFATMKRYNNSSNESFWLENFSGKDLSITRKGEGEIFIRNPFVSLIGSSQPGVLRDTFSHIRKESGLLSRMWLFYPKKPIRPALSFESSTEMHAESVNEYQMRIMELVKHFQQKGKSHTYSISAEGRKLITEWDKKRIQLLESKDYPESKYFISKGLTHALRAALLIQVLNDIYGDGDFAKSISPESLRGGFAVYTTLLNSHERAFPSKKEEISKKQLIVALKMQSNMNQTEIATALGVNKGYVSRILQKSTKI